jgi:signal transduction histidine kinase
MWFGNTEGLLRYDGVSWSRVRVPGGVVRSLAVGPDQRLYVGGVGTFGYIRQNDVGAPQYVPISDESLRGHDVWATFASDGTIYFQTFAGLFEVRGDHIIQVATAGANRFHKAFIVAREDGSSDIFIRQEDVGLLRYDKPSEELRLIDGGAHFADVKVWAMFQHPRGGWIVCTADAIMHLEGSRQLPLGGTELRQAIDGKPIYDGVRISPNRFALGTLGSGVVVIDQAGSVVQHIGRASGLLDDDSVIDVAVDQQSGLWLSLSTGITRVDGLAPLTAFGESQGLAGAVLDMVRYRGVLYAATDVGLFQLQAGRHPGDPASFISAGVQGQTWASTVVGGSLLVAATTGLYDLSERVPHLLTSDASFVVRALRSGENAAVGTERGLMLLRHVRGEWRIEGPVLGVEGSVWSVVEGEEGLVWCATADAVYRVDVRNPASPRVVAQYTLADATVTVLDGVAVISNGEARRPVVSGQLVVDRELTRVFQHVDTSRTVAWSTDSRGRLWIAQGGTLRVFEQDSHAWREATPPVLRTMRYGVRGIFDEGAAVWVGTESGLIRYETNEPSLARYQHPGRVSISSVLVNRRDLIWGGGAPGGGQPRLLRAPSGVGSIRFTFAAPSFNDESSTQYRTRLHGYEETWTEWTFEPGREFGNLPPGTYFLEVQARSGQGVVQRSASLRVIIRPRWHETLLARFVFALAAVSLVVSVAAARIRVHQRQAAAERRRADEFARLNSELQRADKLKDELLANTSHELRTPLTAILGYADLLSEFDGVDTPEDVRETAGYIVNGAQRLYRTVEDMMDAAAIRGDRVELSPRMADVVPILRAVCARYMQAATDKDIDLTVINNLDGEQAYALVDVRAIERVLDHLIENAVKFTNAGNVSVVLSRESTSAAVKIEIVDTGTGISAEALPHIYEAFAQESTGFGRTHEGNGLGLAIARGLALAMGASVQIASSTGVGTTVSVVLQEPSHHESDGDTRLAQLDLAPVGREIE